MELPIFNDNLKSSGSWSATLAAEQQTWKASAESLREYQIEHLLRRSGELHQERLLAATGKISSWAAEPEAKFSLERLMELNET